MNADRLPDLSGRTVLITGGNSGIGKATATALATAGATVVITARNAERGREAVDEIKRASANAAVEVRDLDLARLSTVRSFAEGFLADYPKLDVLILNAGLTAAKRQVTDDGFELLFQVNHLGHFLLTRLLQDRLIESAPSRVVVVASVAHKQARGIDFDDLQSERSYSHMRVYARSKLANILFAGELARRLEGANVTVNALHPGTVRTGWGGDGEGGLILGMGLKLASWAFLSPEQGAQTSVYLAASPDVAGKTGGYYVKRRLQQPSAAARDDEAARRLWEVSEELLGL